ncbi:MAG: LicD family protein [Lachnospiraceae bacterium]|nr:LicD family protein [Lachnospiraceae bacterium]
MKLGDIAKNSKLNLKMISEEEIRNLHKVLLVILDDLLKICDEYNLNFILIGGSAIGALREKGFISWDDDIDIAMPRKDFERLYNIVEKKYAEKYSILHPQSEENYGRILPKIRLKNTDYRTILEYDLNDAGIFIDIYTIENIPDGKCKRFIHGIICLFMGFSLSCRRIYKGYSFFKEYNNGITFKIKAVIGLILSFASIEKWAKWTDYWYSKCKDETSKDVGVPSDDFHYFGEIYSRSDFCNFVETVFEGRKCKIPSNFDSYLKKRYGDYMTPPNVDAHERNSYISYDLGIYKEEF